MKLNWLSIWAGLKLNAWHMNWFKFSYAQAIEEVLFRKTAKMGRIIVIPFLENEIFYSMLQNLHSKVIATLIKQTKQCVFT